MFQSCSNSMQVPFNIFALCPFLDKLENNTRCSNVFAETKPSPPFAVLSLKASRGHTCVSIFDNIAPCFWSNPFWNAAYFVCSQHRRQEPIIHSWRSRSSFASSRIFWFCLPRWTSSSPFPTMLFGTASHSEFRYTYHLSLQKKCSFNQTAVPPNKNSLLKGQS